MVEANNSTSVEHHGGYVAGLLAELAPDEAVPSFHEDLLPAIMREWCGHFGIIRTEHRGGLLRRRRFLGARWEQLPAEGPVQPLPWGEDVFWVFESVEPVAAASSFFGVVDVAMRSSGVSKLVGIPDEKLDAIVELARGGRTWSLIATLTYDRDYLRVVGSRVSVEALRQRWGELRSTGSHHPEGTKADP